MVIKRNIDIDEDENEVNESDHNVSNNKKSSHDSDGKKLSGKHDPAKAEVQSVDSVEDAGDTGPKSKARRGDKLGTGDKKAAKSKSGIVRELYNKMTEMSLEDLEVLSGAMEEGFDEEDRVDSSDRLEAINYDFTDDLNALVESEATLSTEFKDKTAVIFEAALKSKLTDELVRLEEEYAKRLDETVDEIADSVVEQVDSYLNYVVEEWMDNNELAISNGLRTEVAENFMTGLKDLFTESYIEVPEEKVDLVDDLAEQVEDLETELNSTTEKAIKMAEELEAFYRQEIVVEAADGLADTQVEKLLSLVESLDFEDPETFAGKVSTVRESYFTKSDKPNSTILDENFDGENNEDDEVEYSDRMKTYVEVLKKK